MLRGTMAYSLGLMANPRCDVRAIAGCLLELAVDDGAGHWEVAMRSLGLVLARAAGEEVGG